MDWNQQLQNADCSSKTERSTSRKRKRSHGKPWQQERIRFSVWGAIFVKNSWQSWPAKQKEFSLTATALTTVAFNWSSTSTMVFERNSKITLADFPEIVGAVFEREENGCSVPEQCFNVFICRQDVKPARQTLLYVLTMTLMTAPCMRAWSKA